MVSDLVQVSVETVAERTQINRGMMDLGLLTLDIKYMMSGLYLGKPQPP